jgi:hypothetical protein
MPALCLQAHKLKEFIATQATKANVNTILNILSETSQKPNRFTETISIEKARLPALLLKEPLLHDIPFD